MKFRGISAPLKIRVRFYKVNLKNVPLVIFTKGALTHPQKIWEFVLKKCVKNCFAILKICCTHLKKNQKKRP